MIGTTLTANQNQIDVAIPVRVEGRMRIENGDTVFEAKNKLCQYTFYTLVSMLQASGYWSGSTQYGPVNYFNNTNCFAVVGTNTTTVTAYNTTTLTTPIGSPPGTKSTGLNGATSTGTNCCYMTIQHVFPPGLVTGTVGEIGIYNIISGTSIKTGGSAPDNNVGGLCARLAVADGEFDAFTIDTTQPLVVTWVVKVSTDGVLTNQGLYSILNCWCGSGGYCTGISRDFSSKTNSYMVIGSDTTTVNTPTMTQLVVPIGTTPGTKPNTASATASNPTNGVYKATWTATWNAGTVSGTVGEMALYWYENSGLIAHGAAAQGGGPYLCARLSAANTHFSSFVINAAAALTIAWTITFTFA